MNVKTYLSYPYRTWRRAIASLRRYLEARTRGQRLLLVGLLVLVIVALEAVQLARAAYSMGQDRPSIEQPRMILSHEQQ